MARGLGRIPFPLLRVALLAGAGTYGAVWALHRHYTHPPPPMVVTVPVHSAPSSDGDWLADAGAVYDISGTETVP